MCGQHDWHHLKIIHYEKDYYSHFMYGILCKLCAATTWSATDSASSSGSTSAPCYTADPIRNRWNMVIGYKRNVIETLMRPYRNGSPFCWLHDKGGLNSVSIRLNVNLTGRSRHYKTSGYFSLALRAFFGSASGWPVYSALFYSGDFRLFFGSSSGNLAVFC